MPNKAIQKTWLLKPHDAAAALRLAHEFQLSEIAATLVTNRGITDSAAAERFFNPTLAHLHDPFLMKDMREAVDRILLAIQRQEKILIYGDYDVDGTTSTVILKKALSLIGAEVSYYIPERLKDGYGLRQDAMDMARQRGVQLIISVDTGIRAQQVVEYANSLGLDIIITDHHLPEAGLPKANAVLNPKRPDCNYPEKNLAGVGVAFKLAQALLMKTEQARFVESFVKIAAIGTIADIVPLTGENRVIAKYGLAGLREPKNFGLRALLEVAGLSGSKPISGSDVGFRIGPRINAVGRMAGASAAVDLFDAPDLPKALELANAMNVQNVARQQIEADTLALALEQIESHPELRSARVAVISGEGWHRGVIGIVASKVVERLHRPTLIISVEDGLGHGSGRSIPAFHLLEGLESCGDLFERFGGHSHAAGVTIRAEKIEELRRRLNAHAQRVLSAEDLIPVVPIDYELSFKQATLETLYEINRLEPFGSGNPLPTFATYGAQVVERPRILKDKHLKLRVMQAGRWVDCIWWGAAERAAEIFAGDKVSLAYTLSENDYNNNKHLQLIVKDLKVE
ncbi:MAG: single-stranded-DNA-specific exonuclease RecJ [Acidobacteria bacterium]|nr:single-stranded-DNA-specific exonuclease RecJ [Acidobacteriota bacterium]